MKTRWDVARKLYAQRVEQRSLKTDSGYVNLRECVDVSLLQGLEAELRSFGPSTVIVPWLNRPFGSIEGYGTYSRTDAQALIARARSEGWPDPIPGRTYDLAWILRRISDCEKNCVHYK